MGDQRRVQRRGDGWVRADPQRQHQVEERGAQLPCPVGAKLLAPVHPQIDILACLLQGQHDGAGCPDDGLGQ